MNRLRLSTTNTRKEIRCGRSMPTTGAESDAPQKFVLDLRGKSATPEAIQAYQNNLTDVGAVAP